MKRLGVILLVCALVAGGSLVVLGTVSAQEETTVTVSVTDENGNAIEGATVTAAWDDTDEYGAGEDSGETRSSGNVLLDVPTNADEANVEITAEHPDFVQNLPVSVDNTSEVVDVEMREPGSVSIRVVNTNDNPVSNVRLRIRHTNTAIVDVVETGPDGIAEVSELERRSYIVDTNRPGYLSNQTEFELDFAEVDHRIQIEQRNVEIEFSVTDDYLDDSLEGATIQINGEPAGTTTSDGTQVSRRGVNDNYQITVNKEGYDPVTRQLRVGEEPTDFEVAIRRTPEISIEQLQTAVVTGQQTQIQITNAYGDPVSGATVSLNGESVGTTNDQGIATFEVNQAGDNTLLVESDGLEDSATIEGIDESSGNESQNQTEDDEDDDADSVGPGFGAVVALVAIAGLSVALSRRRQTGS